MILTIELVPKTAWYTNVRSAIPKEEWNAIRKKCYALAHFKCEICGSKGPIWPVECHEIWEYDNDVHTQTLKGFIALCPNCHKVKHPGLASKQGLTELVYNQLMNVNNISKLEAKMYLHKAFSTWRKRSEHKWKIDISYINFYLTKKLN